MRKSLNKPTQTPFYETGYESYDSSGNINLEGSIQKIENFMNERDPIKYKSFLKNLKKTKLARHLMGGRDVDKKHELFILVYYWMRLEDDIRDNDIPNHSTSKALTIEQKKAILKKHRSGNFMTGRYCSQLNRLH